MTAIAASPFRVLVACALWALFSLIASTAHATAGQSGTLDPFWANGSALGSGKLITAVGPRLDVASSMVVQSDGKVLVAGFVRTFLSARRATTLTARSTRASVAVEYESPR